MPYTDGMPYDPYTMPLAGVLRGLCAAALGLLLCSCSLLFADKRWAEALDRTGGAHVSTLTGIWGEPGQREGNVLMWSKRMTEQRGGYYYTAYERMRYYDRKGRYAGYSEFPVQRFAPPYMVELWCEIAVSTNGEGLILGTFFEGNSCRNFFPLPEE